MPFPRPSLRHSEFVAIDGDYRRAYDELCRAVRWMRHCQKAYAEEERFTAWQTCHVAEAEVDRLLR